MAIKHESRRPVGIWIRVSTEDQAKGDSPEHHEHRARCYAESKDWEVVETYHLEGVSGKNVVEHPETRRMLKDVASGRIKALIFSKLARLARNTKQLLEFADRFRELDADLVSLQESIDTSTPAGRLFYTMIAAMAQWEREEIADRVAASVPVRAKLGKSLGGRAPFGYQWKDNRLIPHPAEAPIRKEVHELFRTHRRKKTVARLLNQAGHRMRNGGKFSDTTVSRLLTDPIAKGLRRANYTKTPDEKSKWGFKPESEWVYSNVEPIITEELWNACNEILESQQQSRRKPAKKTVHLFAGLIYCGCGKRMYVPSSSKKYSCHPCHNRIATDDMEHIFVENLKGFLLSPDEVKNYLAKVAITRSDHEANLKRLVDEHQAIKLKMDDLFSLHQKGQVPSDGFKDRYTPLFDRQKALERQVAEVESSLDILKVESLSADHMLVEGKNLADRWPRLTPEDKRRIVEDLVEDIAVDQEEVTINMVYFPSATTLENSSKRQRNELGSSPPPA